MRDLTSALQSCEIWRLLRAQFFLIVATASAIGLPVMSTASAAGPKRVLIVNSFGTTAPPFSFQSTAFKSALVAKMGEPVDLDEVSLDMARYDADMQQAIVDYLEKRQAKWRTDLVVAIGAPAVSFVAKHRDQLFRETPILYAAADRRLLPPDALERNAAYVGQFLDIPGVFEDMLQVEPATKNIEIIVGATPLERLWEEAFKKAAEPLAGRIKFTYTSDLSFDQMLQRVATLPPDSYIFFLLLLRDTQGVTVNADEAMQRLHQVARAPINSLFAHQLGTGIVGGRLLQSDRLGKVAADFAIRILHGEPASSLPPTVIERLSPHYDWRELQRWKIDEKLLPPGSTVLFRTPSLWEEHRALIIGGISICVVEGLLIAGLVVNRIRRRRAERSLTESEQRFQNAADAAPVLMWMAGPDKRAMFFNKAWLNFTGRTMEQELGDGWADDVHKDDLENTMRRYQTAFDAREPFVIQNRLRRHDGEFRWMTASGAPRYDGQHNFLGYVGASIDITDLLKKEEALHESEERIALAAEAAHLGVWELNLATNELWVSDQWRSLFQVKPGVPVTLDDVRELIHPDDRDRRTAALQKAIAENSGYEIEYRALLPDKTVRWIAGRARCLPNEHGLPERLLGVSADVTDRKQAEELFRLATEASPSGTVLINAQGRIVLVNAHIEELFSYERHELIDQPIETLIPDRFRAALPGFLAAPHARTMEAGIEFFGRRKDGSEFPVEIRLNPILTSEGRFVLASVIDITERLQAQMETRRLQSEIAHVGRVSMMGQLASALAHEINQPIGAILRNAEAAELFMQRETPDLEEIRAILADIRADDQRAGGVIDRMRALLKRHILDTQLLDLAELIGDVAKLAQPDAAIRHVKLTVNLPTDLPPVRADRVHLQQVLLNLILNGMDALNGAAHEDRCVTVSARVNAARTVEIAVSDTGHGIAAEKLAHVFDPFFTTKPNGMGMGLPISRTIVEAHGGQLWAENNSGTGATFHFTLPPAEETKDEGRATRDGGIG
jgi:two-component system sensor kinase FixL